MVLPKFTIQILTMSCDIDKESKQIRINQNFTQQNFVLYGILMMALSEWLIFVSVDHMCNGRMGTVLMMVLFGLIMFHWSKVYIVITVGPWLSEHLCATSMLKLFRCSLTKFRLLSKSWSKAWIVQISVAISYPWGSFGQSFYMNGSSLWVNYDRSYNWSLWGLLSSKSSLIA